MRRKLRTYSLFSRKSLVNVDRFARALPPSKEIGRFLSALPDIYAGKELKALVNAVAEAHRRKRHVAVAFGGHVIKCGLSPLLVDLIRRKIVTAVAMNGGAAIHDFEISLAGKTSEDVAATLKDGSFGMARETAQAFSAAVRSGARSGRGLGNALGEIVNRRKNRFRRFSVLSAAHEAGIPATVHVALGTDIVHMHPALSAAALGESSLIDFRKLIGVVKGLERGVWLNVGSAVILPEVFLKALTVARNRGAKIRDFTTANLDMIQHYRPTVNVLQRPGGRAIALTGRHEILLPLLHAGILAVLEGDATS
ncbi:MAG: hypothetical protein A2Z34_00525 [Planctomycetes bacterium RBG_16_59_8]|nr:MAG: hypothetical protein A2Z34_00525 [Planctomycetes bacterium RBG_16_59_8]